MDIRPVDIAIAIVNTFVTFLFIRAFIFKPVYKFVQARNQRIAAAQAEIDAFEKGASEKQAKAEEALNSVSSHVDSIIAEARQTASSQAQGILEEARVQAAEIIGSAKQKAMETHKKAAQEQYHAVVDLSRELAGRILQREMTVEDNQRIADAFFEKVQKGAQQ